MSTKKRRRRDQRNSGSSHKQSSGSGKTQQKHPAVEEINPNSKTWANPVIQQGLQRTLYLADSKPRWAALLNVGAYVLQGIVLGLVMGLIASLLTSGLPKVWTYAANTFAMMLLRVILQWIWALKVTTWVRKGSAWFVKDKSGVDLPEEALKQVSITNNVSTIIGPAVVAVAIATILSTESVEPTWLTRTWAIIGISALGSGLASGMEALGLSSNIYAFRWNRHPYQENPNFIQGKEQRRTNGSRS